MKQTKTVKREKKAPKELLTAETIRELSEESVTEAVKMAEEVEKLGEYITKAVVTISFVCDTADPEDDV